MSFFQGDVIIRSTIMKGLQELRDNPWLIEDMFSQFICDPTLVNEYGMNEIQRAKDFLLKTEIEVVMRYRNDSTKFPYVSIAMLDSREMRERSLLSDLGSQSDERTGESIDQPVPFVIGPFFPKKFDTVTGRITLPDGVSTLNVAVGQAIVDTTSGVGATIKEVIDAKTIRINAGVEFDFNQLGVVPQFLTLKNRRGLLYFKEQYQIGCHVSGEPYLLLYLHTAIEFILLRKKEELLERRGFEISMHWSSDITNTKFFESSENAFSRFINLEGQVEKSFPLEPKRTIEDAVFRDSSVEDATDDEILCTSSIRIIDGDTSISPDGEDNE